MMKLLKRIMPEVIDLQGQGYYSEPVQSKLYFAIAVVTLTFVSCLCDFYI